MTYGEQASVILELELANTLVYSSSSRCNYGPLPLVAKGGLVGAREVFDTISQIIYHELLLFFFFFYKDKILHTIYWHF